MQSNFNNFQQQPQQQQPLQTSYVAQPQYQQGVGQPQQPMQQQQQVMQQQPMQQQPMQQQMQQQPQQQQPIQSAQAQMSQAQQQQQQPIQQGSATPQQPTPPPSGQPIAQTIAQQPLSQQMQQYVQPGQQQLATLSQPCDIRSIQQQQHHPQPQNMHYSSLHNHTYPNMASNGTPAAMDPSLHKNHPAAPPAPSDNRLVFQNIDYFDQHKLTDFAESKESQDFRDDLEAISNKMFLDNDNLDILYEIHQQFIDNKNYMNILYNLYLNQYSTYVNKYPILPSYFYLALYMHFFKNDAAFFDLFKADSLQTRYHVTEQILPRYNRNKLLSNLEVTFSALNKRLHSDTIATDEPSTSAAAEVGSTPPKPQYKKMRHPFYTTAAYTEHINMFTLNKLVSTHLLSNFATTRYRAQQCFVKRYGAGNNSATYRGIKIEFGTPVFAAIGMIKTKMAVFRVEGFETLINLLNTATNTSFSSGSMSMGIQADLNITILPKCNTIKPDTGNLDLLKQMYHNHFLFGIFNGASVFGVQGNTLDVRAFPSKLIFVPHDVLHNASFIDGVYTSLKRELRLLNIANLNMFYEYNAYIQKGYTPPTFNTGSKKARLETTTTTTTSSSPSTVTIDTVPPPQQQQQTITVEAVSTALNNLNPVVKSDNIIDVVTPELPIAAPQQQQPDTPGPVAAIVVDFEDEDEDDDDTPVASTKLA